MSLSPQQIRAAELLSKGHSHQAVGESVGVSRRTILRWLKQPDFKNLSYGLVGRSSQPPPQQSPQPSQERRRQSTSLTPEDLVQDALEAVQSILMDSEARTCDRLKAAALVGEWSGKMAEAEALKLLIEANWVSDEVLEVLLDAGAELEKRMKNALANGRQNGTENGHKKSLLQVSEGGTFDDEFDDEDE